MAHIPRGTHYNVISVTSCCGAHPTKAMCRGLIFRSKNLHVRVKIRPKVVVSNDNIASATRIFYYGFANENLNGLRGHEKIAPNCFLPFTYSITLTHVNES